MKHHKYCHVKRVAQFHIGGLAARSGAWNRKYRVVDVTYIKEFTDYHEYLVTLKFLGHYYADGRVVLPRKSRKVKSLFKRAFLSKGNSVHYVPNASHNVAGPQLNYASGYCAVEVK